MDTMEVLINDHSALRAALKNIEGHLGPSWSCGWDDRVELDAAAFHRDLDALFRALREHEAIEEKLVSNWADQPRTTDAPAEKILLASHASIDSLLKLFSAVAVLIADGPVHAARTILSRLHEELTRHMDEEERDFFPLLPRRQDGGAAHARA